SRRRHAQAYPAVLALDPEAAVVQVRLEGADRLVIGVRDVVTLHRLFAGDFADAGHRGLRISAKGADYTAKLQQSALRERDRLMAGDDEVIERLDLDQRERFLQVARQELVRLARLRDTRRMVVSKDHRHPSGVAQPSQSDELLTR